MDTLFVALRVIVSLGVVIGLLWMLQRRLTKGSKRVRSSKLVQVVTRQGIAQKASVVVVDMGGQRFLLGVTEHSVTVLSAGDAPVAELVELVETEKPVELVETEKPVELVESEKPVELVETTAAPSATGVSTSSTGLGGSTGPVAGVSTSSTGVPGFAAALSAAKKNPLPTTFTGFDPKTGQPRRSALDGSIISPATWRRAASALRSGK